MNLPTNLKNEDFNPSPAEYDGSAIQFMETEMDADRPAPTREEAPWFYAKDGNVELVDPLAKADTSPKNVVTVASTVMSLDSLTQITTVNFPFINTNVKKTTILTHWKAIKRAKKRLKGRKATRVTPTRVKRHANALRYADIHGKMYKCVKQLMREEEYPLPPLDKIKNAGHETLHSSHKLV